MKKSCIILVLLLAASLTGKVYGQSAYRSFFPASEIKPYRLEVGYEKTTVLIFPVAISAGGIDRGSSGIIAKAVPGIENILKVKANSKNFPETNLTVITKDGKVYPFTVDYSNNPPDAPIDMGKQKQTEKRIAVFQNQKLNTAQVKRLCKEAATGNPFLHKRTKSFRVQLKLQGIYTCKDVICYCFLLKNKSNINYAIDFSKFYIRDRKQVKRTAQQEKELHPLDFYYAGDVQEIPGKTSQVLVVAFSKFTIADHKNLVVQLFEKQGDRNLTLKINGRDLAKAKLLKLDQ